MKSDSEFYTETVIEKDCRQVEQSHSPIYDSEEYQHTKPSQEKKGIQSRHGDFRPEPVDEKEYCMRKDQEKEYCTRKSFLL
ncbi:hypothetical protein SUGI_0009960 [Cryptomeria japonica]|nr:hypothetical protein SUGI_0009960 [Cryptomeria japonica]